MTPVVYSWRGCSIILQAIMLVVVSCCFYNVAVIVEGKCVIKLRLLSDLLIAVTNHKDNKFVCLLSQKQMPLRGTKKRTVVNTCLWG